MEKATPIRDGRRKFLGLSGVTPRRGVYDSLARCGGLLLLLFVIDICCCCNCWGGGEREIKKGKKKFFGGIYNLNTCFVISSFSCLMELF